MAEILLSLRALKFCYDYLNFKVETYILSDETGMHPTLKYAQEGSRLGLIDWKDAYFFLDAITLLQRAGAFSERQVFDNF